MNTIAYINDDPIDSWLALEVLEQSNLFEEIISATNGDDGLKALLYYYEKNGMLPDLIN